MYGSPADPTFDQAYLRELRAQGRTCASCQFNVQKPGDKRCSKDHGSWPRGPCSRYEEKDYAEEREVKTG